MASTADQEAREFLARLGDAHRAAGAAPRAPRNKLVDFFAFQPLDHDRMARGGRAFEGGRVDRLTEEWNPGTIGPNAAVRMDAKRMRERARWLVANNPLAKSAVDKFVANVISEGLKPSPEIESTDDRRTFVRAWNRWGGMSPLATREADLTADQTLDELYALQLSEVLVAGGCLKHYVEAPRRGRLLPTAIELLPEERFADHVLRSPGNAKTANPIEDGIEFDPATGRTVAYHVVKAIPNDSTVHLADLEVERLPAERCDYLRFKKRIGSRRGHSHFHAVVVWLWALGYYTDNELHASNLKSSWAYFLRTDPEAAADAFDWDGLVDSDGTPGTQDFHGNRIDHHQAGMIFRGAPGDDLKPVGPNVPGSDSQPWLEMLQRLIAVGVEHTYEELTGDYSKGNMASVRMSRDSIQRLYRRMHRWLVGHSANPDWSRFVRAASEAFLPGFPRPSVLAADLDEWVAVEWSKPVWNSPNPVHDATARKIDKSIGAITDRDMVEAGGKADLEAHYDQLAYERDEKAERNLRFEADATDPAIVPPGGSLLAGAVPGNEDDDQPEDDD